MKYRNISKLTQSLIGFGVVKSNETIETKEKINNPNFELVSEETAPKKIWQKKKDSKPKRG